MLSRTRRVCLVTKGLLWPKYILKLFFYGPNILLLRLYWEVSETSHNKTFRLTAFPDKQPRITSSRFKNTVTCANGNTVSCLSCLILKVNSVSFKIFCFFTITYWIILTKVMKYYGESQTFGIAFEIALPEYCTGRYSQEHSVKISVI